MTSQANSGGFRSVRPARWLGRMATRTALLVLAGSALLGTFVTLAAGQEPGDLLGFFVIAGTIAAALGIRRGRIYLLLPGPVLSFFVAAVVTGKVHDANLGSSSAAFAVGFAQWAAGVFLPAEVATVAVLLVAGGRWLLGRQFANGQPVHSASQSDLGKSSLASRDRRSGEMQSVTYDVERKERILSSGIGGAGSCQVVNTHGRLQ